jgi:CheY-like chemotaxis protein
MRVSSIGGNDDAQIRGNASRPRSGNVAACALEPSRVNGDARSGGTQQSQHVVLLVEDNIADVFLIQRAIEKYGLSVNLIVEEDGEKALQFLDSLQDDPGVPCPEVVLLDLNLPRRSGADVLQAVRTSDRCGDVPVVVITSSDSQEDRDRAVQLGATQYFRKPNAYREFLQIGQIMKDYLSPHEPRP